MLNCSGYWVIESQSQVHGREDRGWPSLRSFNSISAFAPSMCKESVRKGVIVLKTSQGSHCWSGIVFKVRGVSAVTPEWKREARRWTETPLQLASSAGDGCSAGRGSQMQTVPAWSAAILACYPVSRLFRSLQACAWEQRGEITVSCFAF